MFHNSCFVFVVAFLIASKYANSQYIQTMEEKIKDRIFANYSTSQRPVNDSRDIVTVSMSMMFVSMLALVEKDQVLSSGSWLQLRWMDYRLKWDPAEFDGLDLIVVDPDKVWVPKLAVFNSIEYFPYDQQVCPFYIGFLNLPASIARLEVRGTSMFYYNTTTQWDITAFTGNISSDYIPDMTSQRPLEKQTTAVFCLFLRRDPTYYFNSLIIPSTCLCLLALMTFLAPPDCGERVSVGISMVLGLTVFQLLMSDLLPVSNERSILSDYLSWNFISVVITVPWSLGNMSLAYGDKSTYLPKWKWYRRLCLEYLPVIMFTPSLSQRMDKIRRTRKVSPSEQLKLEDLEHTNVKTEEEKSNDKCPDDTDEDLDDLDHHQKMLLEARTLAVVADRLAFNILFWTLVVRVILLINNFSQQEELLHFTF